MSDRFDQIYDRRNFRRVSVDGNAKVHFDGIWNNCGIVDMSGGGACFKSRPKPALGTSVMVQIKGVGILRAEVVKTTLDDFSVSFNPADVDSDAVVDNLTFLVNRHLFASPSAAKHEAVPQGHIEDDDDDMDGDDAPTEGEGGSRLKRLMRFGARAGR